MLGSLGGQLVATRVPYPVQMMLNVAHLTIDQVVHLLSMCKYIHKSAAGHQRSFWAKLERYVRKAALYIRSCTPFDNHGDQLRNKNQKDNAVWNNDHPEAELDPYIEQVPFLATEIRDGRCWGCAREIGPGWIIMMAAGPAPLSWTRQELNDIKLTDLISHVLMNRPPLATGLGTWEARLLSGCTGMFVEDGVQVVLPKATQG